MGRTRAMRVLLMGPPGGGKGTVGKYMANDFDLRIISTGDVLRSEISKGTEEGHAAAAVIKQGGLVSDDIMSAMLRRLLASETHSWLLDGYPRTVEQAAILRDLLAELGLELDGIFNLQVPEEVILPRIADRWVHPGSGRVYNDHFSPPKEPGKDDETGEALVKRPDDHPDTVRKRLRIYAQSTAPILDLFSESYDGALHHIACNSSPEGYEKIKPILESVHASKT